MALFFAHIIFIIFHFVAWFTIKYLLILTIGLHLIYATTSNASRKADKKLEEQVELLKEQTRVMKGEEPEQEPEHPELEPIPRTKGEKVFTNAIWIILFGTIFSMIVYYLISY